MVFFFSVGIFFKEEHKREVSLREIPYFKTEMENLVNTPIWQSESAYTV